MGQGEILAFFVVAVQYAMGGWDLAAAYPQALSVVRGGMAYLQGEGLIASTWPRNGAGRAAQPAPPALVVPPAPKPAVAASVTPAEPLPASGPAPDVRAYVTDMLGGNDAKAIQFLDALIKLGVVIPEVK